MHLVHRAVKTYKFCVTFLTARLHRVPICSWKGQRSRSLTSKTSTAIIVTIVATNNKTTHSFARGSRKLDGRPHNMSTPSVDMFSYYNHQIEHLGWFRVFLGRHTSESVEMSDLQSSLSKGTTVFYYYTDIDWVFIIFSIDIYVYCLHFLCFHFT